MSALKILVVDDEREIAAYFGKLVSGIARGGGSVETFYSGVKALERLKEIDFDLLITDIVMPVVSGMELLKYVAANSPVTEVVFLTAHDSFEYIYEINKIKKSGYIMKTEKESTVVTEITNAIKKIENRNRDFETLDYAKRQIEEVKKVLSEKQTKQLIYNEDTVSEEELAVIRNIKEYIKENICKDISAASIAQAFHYSPTYLSKLFGKYGRKKLSAYIMDEKMKTAKLMLVNSNKSVDKISAALGYQSPQAFARAFRRELQITPQDYRRQYGALTL